MNTRELLEASIVAHLGEVAPILALADWLMEFENLSQFAALRVAAKIRRDRVNARELAEAAKLVGGSGLTARSLRLMVLLHVGEEQDAQLAIVAVPGSRAPRLHHKPRAQRTHYWGFTTITVGARWLICAARSFKNGMRSYRKDRADS